MELLHPSEIDLAVPVSQVAVIDMVDPSFAALKHHYNGHLQFENNRNNDVVLEETKNMGKSVVDHEGFPRSDLDFGELANYRNLKRRRA